MYPVGSITHNFFLQFNQLAKWDQVDAMRSKFVYPMERTGELVSKIFFFV